MLTTNAAEPSAQRAEAFARTLETIALYLTPSMKNLKQLNDAAQGQRNDLQYPRLTDTLVV